MVFALVFATAACDGPVGPEGPAGQQGEQGEQGPQGPEGSQGPAGEDGEDGNANVTQYLFDGQDFSSDPIAVRCTPTNFGETILSTWLYFLVQLPDNRPYAIPGYGIDGDSEYRVFLEHDRNPCGGGGYHRITRETGTGENYEQIRVFRIDSSSTEDCTGGGCLRAEDASPLPADLDVSDYQAVMDYYGLSAADAIRL